VNYDDFVASKLTRVPPTGLAEVPNLGDHLFPFQRDLCAWSLRRGRAAIFAGTGLGKTSMQLTWARHAGKRVLLLAPLAVGAQTKREGDRIGIDSRVVRENAGIQDGINITNYDRLHKFDCSQFDAVVLDESGIIKNEASKTLRALIEAFAHTPFKLCATEAGE
jgi:superfamily II DNA or RNA helicase